MAKKKTEQAQLIPAVAYTRKSTKGKSRGKIKQERSLKTQKAEIEKLAAREGYNILKWFEDEGISGTKRGAKRPSYTKMISEVKQLGAKAVIVDAMNRFSRATKDDVDEDVRLLRDAGCRWIVTVSRGEFDLEASKRNDIGGMINFTVAVWEGHQWVV